MKQNAIHARHVGVLRGFAALVAIAVLALACVLFASSALAPVQARAASSTTVQIEVEQKFKSDTTGVNEKFQYRLEPQTEGAPMPRGTKDGVYTWTMKGATKTTVDIELAGVERNVPFTYKMYQVTPEDTDGYFLDDTVYYPEVTLLGNGQPRYIVRLEDGAKPSKLAWAVEYDSTSIGDDDTPTDDSDGDDDDPSIGDDDTPTDDSDGDDPYADEDTEDGNTPTRPVSTGDMLMLGACGLLIVSLAGAALALRRRDREEDEA